MAARTRGMAAALAAGAVLAATGASAAADPGTIPTATPLTNPVVTAVLVQGHPTTTVPRADGPVVRPGPPRPDVDPAALLADATAPDRPAVIGHQTVFVRENAAAPFRTIDADTRTAPGGSTVAFPDGTTSFVPTPPAADPTPGAVPRVWGVTDGVDVADHPTLQVTARLEDADGPVTTRLWVDRDTHQILWHQTYAPSGALLLSAGYRSLG